MFNIKKFFSLKCRLVVIVLVLTIANFVAFGSISLFTQNANNLLIHIQRQIDIYTVALQRTDIVDAYKIKQANMEIENREENVFGSGSHIKIDGQSYILSCAHLVEKKQNKVWAMLNDGDEYKLEVVKINKKQDLVLFKIKNMEIPYFEISTEILREGDDVIVVSNPGTLTDIITKGNIAKITKDKYYFTNKIFYGSSGGAILYKGKIIGVSYAMESFWEITKESMRTVNYGVAIRGERIRKFLSGIKGII